MPEFASFELAIALKGSSCTSIAARLDGRLMRNGKFGCEPHERTDAKQESGPDAPV